MDKKITDDFLNKFLSACNNVFDFMNLIAELRKNRDDNIDIKNIFFTPEVFENDGFKKNTKKTEFLKKILKKSNIGNYSLFSLLRLPEADLLKNYDEAFTYSSKPSSKPSVSPSSPSSKPSTKPSSKPSVSPSSPSSKPSVSSVTDSNLTYTMPSEGMTTLQLTRLELLRIIPILRNILIPKIKQHLTFEFYHNKIDKLSDYLTSLETRINSNLDMSQDEMDEIFDEINKIKIELFRELELIYDSKSIPKEQIDELKYRYNLLGGAKKRRSNKTSKRGSKKGSKRASKKGSKKSSKKSSKKAVRK